MLSVALCTYNGEKYILEQLESLAKQTLLPDELVISDDASVDSTLEIARKFASNAPFAVNFLEHSKPQGALRNFSNAICKCKGDYIALCDQDDVWMPEKLSMSMIRMKEGELQKGAASPLLVHTDLQVTDQDLSCVHPSMFRAQHLRDEPDMEQALRVLLTQNYVTGCTILMNRALVRQACPIPSEAAVHDWWLALYASASGHILFVDRPTMHYRQHAKNQIGARKYFSTANAKKLFSFKKIRDSMERALRQDMAFVDSIRTVRPAGALAQNYLDAIRSKAYNKVRSMDIHMQDPLRNLVFHIFLYIWQEHFSRFLANQKE